MGVPEMVDSESEFHDALTALVLEAAEKGIDVEGGWDVRNPDGRQSDWTVEILELAKPILNENR